MIDHELNEILFENRLAIILRSQTCNKVKFNARLRLSSADFKHYLNFLSQKFCSATNNFFYVILILEK